MNIPRNRRNNKRTPQRSVLQNDDLIRKILEYIAVRAEDRYIWQGYRDYREEIKPSRQHLYNAALVSRSFYEPALDLLWRIMDSLEPLLALLPSSVLRRQGNSYAMLSISPDYKLFRAVKRFTLYSRKVKAFYYTPHNRPRGVNLDWHIFHAINSHPGVPKPLLPCLRILYITSLSRTVTHSFLFNVLSQSLCKLTILSLQQSDDDTVRTFITCLLFTAPYITHLRVLDNLPDDVQRQLLQLVHLRSLQLKEISPVTFVELCIGGLNRLHCLETLQMRIQARDPKVIAGESISCDTLTRLYVHCNASFVLKFLDLLSLPRLQELELAFPSTYPTRNASSSNSQSQWSGLATFLTKIVEKWPSTLTRTMVRGGAVELGSLSRLHSLVGRVHLRLLMFESCCSPTQLSDIDWWYLGRTLPDIRYLFLPVSYTISWSCLRRLVLMCPRLLHLQVGLDGASFPSSSDTITTSFVHGLETLSVGDTAVKDAYSTARHLVHLFPILTHVSSDSSSGWKSVNKLIAFVRSVLVGSLSSLDISANELVVLRSRLIKSWADPNLPDDLSIGTLPTIPRGLRPRRNPHRESDNTYRRHTVYHS